MLSYEFVASLLFSCSWFLLNWKNSSNIKMIQLIVFAWWSFQQYSFSCHKFASLYTYSYYEGIIQLNIYDYLRLEAKWSPLFRLLYSECLHRVRTQNKPSLVKKFYKFTWGLNSIQDITRYIFFCLINRPESLHIHCIQESTWTSIKEVKI